MDLCEGAESDGICLQWFPSDFSSKNIIFFVILGLQPHQLHICRRIFYWYLFGSAGQVVVNTSLPHGTDSLSSILSIKPIAVSSSAQAQFVVKGFNLSRPSSRYLGNIMFSLLLSLL